jgi:hypothetical protein
MQTNHPPTPKEVVSCVCVERLLKIKIVPLGINAFLALLQQNYFFFSLFFFVSYQKKTVADVKVRITAVISCSHFSLAQNFSIARTNFSFSSRNFESIKDERASNLSLKKRKKQK